MPTKPPPPSWTRQAIRTSWRGLRRWYEAVVAMGHIHRHPRITVFKDKGHGYRWRLLALNGKIVADSAESYKTQGGALRAARRLHDIAFEAVVDPDPQEAA